MKELTISQIIEAVSGILLCGKKSVKIKGVSIDSRTIKKGELFIAIIGEKFDGHTFVKQAIAKGAAAVIVDRSVEVSDIPVIKVEDTTRALQKLANYYRNIFEKLTVLAITGSAGKTTTKDITASVLNQVYNVKKTQGNLNNYFGLPLTLFSLEGNEDFAVLEMGMSKRGEIQRLARIAEPEIGIITNVGPAHLQQLGSIANIARAKRELIEELPETGLAFLNYDNFHVCQMGNYFSGETIYYSLEDPSADIFTDRIKFSKKSLSINFRVHFRGKKYNFLFPGPGLHNIYNALPVIALALKKDFSEENIRNGLIKSKFSSLRMEIIEDSGFTIINDSYNANPLSMRSAIDVLKELSTGRSIAVLADMLELGKKEIKEHQDIGKYIYQKKIDYLITVGKLGNYIWQGAKIAGMSSASIKKANNKKEAAAILSEIITEGDTILLKGSRGMEIEKIINLLNINYK